MSITITILRPTGITDTIDITKKYNDRYCAIHNDCLLHCMQCTAEACKKAKTGKVLSIRGEGTKRIRTISADDQKILDNSKMHNDMYNEGEDDGYNPANYIKSIWISEPIVIEIFA